jgi:transcriptional regulator with XRE-family HTH domain
MAAGARYFVHSYWTFSLYIQHLLCKYHPMISLKKTTVAVIREILGSPTGSEQVFSKITGLSISTIKKISAGNYPITPKSALAISEAIGVSGDWINRNDPNIPPLERDNRTPYTRDSYDRWLKKKGTQIGPSDNLGVAQDLIEIIECFLIAVIKRNGSSARNDLWEFARLMEGKYGPSIHGGISHESISGVLSQMARVSKWRNHKPDANESMDEKEYIFPEDS